MVKINGKEVDGREVAQVIREQPGYSGEGSYMVTRATTGGYRLYKDVGGNWMDASLNDAPALAEHVNTDAASMGRKGGAAKTDAKRAASAANGAKGGRPRKQS